MARLVGQRRLEGAHAQLAELSSKLASYAAELSSARAFAESEKGRHRQELRQVTAGVAVSTAWWRKRVQLATVRAIMEDRRAAEERRRSDELEERLVGLMGANDEVVELERRRAEAVDGLAACREELGEAHAAAAAAARERERLSALAERTAQHEVLVEIDALWSSSSKRSAVSGGSRRPTLSATGSSPTTSRGRRAHGRVPPARGGAAGEARARGARRVRPVGQGDARAHGGDAAPRRAPW